MKAPGSSRWQGVIHRYGEFLPVTERTPRVSLCEGGTPLIPAPGFAAAVGGGFRLYLKFEGLNPTASFKDRGMSLAISKACERGSAMVACASTGNTSASAAAYAARAGLRCLVILPEEGIAAGKLSQALIHGAETIAVRGSFDDALGLVRQLGETGRAEIVNSINPVRIEGQKTAAFEICDALGRAPDYHFLPVGNAGNIVAYHRGFLEYRRRGLSQGVPRMCGYQAAGAAPLADGRPVPRPETVASAIRIGRPASGEAALLAARESGGWIGKATDEEILEAYREVARSDGIFVEPASAAPLAGLARLSRQGRIPRDSLVSATMTGHGLKDPGRALAVAGIEPRKVDPDFGSLRDLLGL